MADNGARRRVKGTEVQGAAVVLGLVAAVGSDLDAVQELLERLLAEFSYRASVIRITDLLRRGTVGGRKVPTKPEGTRLAAFMDLGNTIRNQAKSGDALALYAAAEIKRLRSDRDDRRTAYIIRTLKHPDEVSALRRIYGHGFFLIALYSDEESRRNYMIDRQNIAKNEAIGLIQRDQEEADEFGQQT